MFLIACGSKLLTRSGYAYLHDWVSRQVWFKLGSKHCFVDDMKSIRKYFDHMFCFPAPNLQSRRIARFIAHYVERVIYELVAPDRAIPQILEEDPRMGLHTHVLHVSSLGRSRVNARRYVWSQRSRRPFGYPSPTYCPVCQFVKSYDCDGMNHSRNTLTWYCQGTLLAKEDSQTGFEAGCSESVTVSLTREERELRRGGGGICGSWQSHRFEWSEELIARF